MIHQQQNFQDIPMRHVLFSKFWLSDDVGKVVSSVSSGRMSRECGSGLTSRGNASNICGTRRLVVFFLEEHDKNNITIRRTPITSPRLSPSPSGRIFSLLSTPFCSASSEEKGAAVVLVDETSILEHEVQVVKLVEVVAVVREELVESGCIDVVEVDGHVERPRLVCSQQ